MRWATGLVLTGFAFGSGGAAGVLLVPRAGMASDPVSITRVAGPRAETVTIERSAGASASLPPASGPEAPDARAALPSVEPLKRLAPQQIAKRALQWSASIRGDGVYGAGIVVDTRGYVLTNHHVIQGLEKIRVQFVDTPEMPGKVVAVDKDLDLALLKVDAVRPLAAPAGDFLTAEVGDDVFAVGCPRKMNFTVSRGMVSFVGRRIDGNYYLQSDLATNDGNSGGPVVNDRGEVIAVMTFILRDSQGLAFAVPISYAYERFSEVLRTDRLDLSRFERWRKEQDDQATASR